MVALRNLQLAQEKNSSIICLGLDLDPKRMPNEYTNSTKGMFDFAVRMIDATADKVCAYKPNMAFFESLGTEGWSLLKLIIDRIPEGIPVILDGKRGDIGNTASHYATSMFEDFGADWVTLNPYMGYDAMRPFLEYKDKGVFVLCLTSNAGSKDFQELLVDGKPLYRIVAEKVDYWNKDDNCGLVVGATHPDQLSEIRKVAHDMPLLIPGVGAQGGSLENAARVGTDGFRKTAVINVSRTVLYASNGSDFAQRARAELEKLNSTVGAINSNFATESPETQEPESKSSVSITLSTATSVPETSSNQSDNDSTNAASHDVGVSNKVSHDNNPNVVPARDDQGEQRDVQHHSEVSSGNSTNNDRAKNNNRPPNQTGEHQ